MPHHLRQQFLPAFYSQIKGRSKCLSVPAQDSLIAIFSRLPKPSDPLRLKIFDAKRTIPYRARFDGYQMEYFFQPPGCFYILAGFNMRRKDTASMIEIIIEPIYSWIN